MPQDNAVAPAPAAGVTRGTASGPRWLALAVIMLAQLMVVLDATVVNVALPHAQAALDISNADRQWIVTAYTLTFGGLLLLGGRIADYFGRKRTFMIGLIGFAAASALGGVAVNEGMLFGARALQGAFGALLAPAALSLLTVTFTEAKERAKAFGVFGAISGGGAAIGLISGGVLTQYASWRWCLLVNIPIAVIALRRGHPAWCTRARRRATRATTSPVRSSPPPAWCALVYGFTEAAKPHGTSTNGWAAAMTIGMLAAAVVLLAAFLWWESRTNNPLLPLRVITRPQPWHVVHGVDPGRRRAVGHVPVHDVLPAADPALQPAKDRHRLPAVLRRHHLGRRHRSTVPAARRAADPDDDRWRAGDGRRWCG